MSLRKFIAIVALINALVAAYLHLWKIGLAGSLACGGTGGCEYIQGSRYGWFLGVDVALIGAVGYTLIFVVATVGSLTQFEDEAWPARALQLLVFPAFLFTLRLKYAEFIILKGFCPWCAVSAVSITVLTALMFVEWKRVTAAPSPAP
ncbi:vitamin K epoxide reductase family protein [Gemmatimonas sp.]|uniref:vitamin K epoxide reductase family protein n=1 Tax=Gemmatimonas sp. TaxID=1962908 RepID=UPI0037C0054C